MRKIRRILVPIRDFNARVVPAIEKAAQLAEAWGARMELFHDLVNPVLVESLSTPGYTLREIKADGRRAAIAGLERLAAPLRRQGLTISTAVAWDYPPFEAIVRRAISIRAGLIVAPRRDRHRLASLLGYIDWELLRLSPIPVLLVKSSAAYRNPTILAAVDPEHKFSKSSGLDRRILEAADSVSRALRGSLHAMNAYLPLPLPPPPSVLLDNRIPAKALKLAEKNARKGFDRALEKTTIRASNRHLVRGDPAGAIAATARRTRSAIIVLGAVSRSGLKRLFIGNTAERVLDDLRCDVLVVKPAHFALKVPRARRGVQLVSVVSYTI